MSRCDQRSAEASRYRRWYKLAVWLKLRDWRLSIEPTCRTCARRGHTTPANTVDHVRPHRGNWDKFMDPDNTQSLCAPCHSRAKQSEEAKGYSTEIGADGYPIDPRHPANRR